MRQLRTQGLVGAFNSIILLAVMSSLLPYALCSLAELMIRLKGNQGLSGARLAKVGLLGCLGFLYSGWALYGSGAETVFLGTLLIAAKAMRLFADRMVDRNEARLLLKAAGR